MGESFDYADEQLPVVWSAGVVAHRLGIAPATLRSWHRRYGLDPVAQQPGGHRRYTERDVAVLETMARLVGQGVVPAAAAEIARDDGRPPEPSVGDGDAVTLIAAQASRGLLLAAQRLDAETLRHVLDDDFANHGLERTWNGLCVPVLTALGHRATPTGGCIDAVLLLSWAITASLHRVYGPVRSTSRARQSLLACADGERHSLGLEALHAGLVERQIPANMLGASVPTSVLAAAADRIRPAVVVIWSQAPRTARPGLLRKLRGLTDTTLAAGPGWDGAVLPATVQRVTSLHDALDVVVQATRLGGQSGPTPVKGAR